MSRYGYEERGSVHGSLAVLAGAAFFIGGLLIGHASEGVKADDRVRDTQIQNEQIYDQLTHDNTRKVDGLALNDEEHKFRFNTVDQNGAAEVCEGHYEVKADIANLVGDLACTQTVPVEHK